MNTNQIWQAAKVAAGRIVEEYQRLYPRSSRVKAFGVGGGSTDNTFRRAGTSRNDLSTALPSLLSDLLNSNASTSAPDAGLASSQRTFLSSLLNRDQNATPGKSTLDATMGIDPTTFGGSPTLTTIMGRNPYSSQFEADTESAFRQRSADALAQVQSGHEAVRGGQSRSGIAQGVMATRLGQERGQEVRNAQVQDAGIVSNATGLSNTIEGGRRALQLGAQQQLGNQSIGRTASTVDAARQVDSARGQHSAALALASQLLGLRTGLTTDDVSGQGTGNTSSWGVNILGGCCFIFLQSLNGTLPPFVERARDEFYTPVRRRGYKWMSSWLVPWMARSRFVTHATNALIVLPCLLWGATYYKVTPRKWPRVLKPWVFGLFHLWHILGLTLGRRVK